MVKIIVTGSACFIGYSIAQKLLSQGLEVIGIDCFTNYYDINLKEQRNINLEKFNKFNLIRSKI